MGSREWRVGPLARGHFRASLAPRSPVLRASHPWWLLLLPLSPAEGHTVPWLGEGLGVLLFPSWDTQVGISSPQQMGGPPPTPGTATSALGKWVRAGNRFFPHWVAASYPLSTRHAAAGPDFKVGAAEHSALSMGPFWAWDPVGLHWSCTHSAPGTGARTRKQEEARRYPPARPAPPTPTSKWGPSWPRGSPGKGRIILWTKAFSSLYYCPVGSIFPFYSSSCFLPT